MGGEDPPVGSTPANLGVGRAGAIDARLAVDGQEALPVEGDKLVLDVAGLQLQAVHLTPRQHAHSCACVRNRQEGQNMLEALQPVTGTVCRAR